MSIYEVETEDGIYEVEVDDSGEQQQSQKDAPLPNLEQTELKRSGRTDLLSQFDLAKEKTLNPLARAENEMKLVGGVMQRGEAMIANPAAEMQKGNFNPRNLLDVMVEGARGKVLGEFGDLVRNTGVGRDYNEALASTTGFLAALKLGDIPTGGKLTKKIAGSEKSLVNTGGKVISQADQAVKDAVTKKTGFLEDMQSAFYEAKSSAVEKYGEGIENLAKNNPNVKVNLRSVVDELNQAIALDPKIRNAVSKVPNLINYLDNPKLANKVNLREAQDIVNMVQSRVSSGKLQGVGVRPDDIPLLDVIHDMKKSMVDAFPDIASLRKGYGDVIQKFNGLRSRFSRSALPSNVKSKFGGNELLQDDLKSLLEKDSPEILQRMRNYAMLRKVGKLAGGALITGAAGSVIGGGIGLGMKLARN